MIDPKVRTLLAIVKEGSYSRAAESLALSQPAASYHIKQLESEYQIKIFYRNAKNLMLTPEGEVLLRYARRLENMEQDCRRSLEDLRLNASHFTVGITPSIGETVIAKVFPVYCSLHANTHVSIITNTVEQLSQRLESYEMDFAIVDGSLSLKHCRTELLDMDYLSVVMSPANPLAKKSSVTLEELKKERLILRREEAGTRRLFESSLTGRMESIHNFDVRLEMDNINAIKELAAANLGVSIMANSACREELAKGTLTALPVENMPMIREINIVCQDDFRHPEVLEELRRIHAAIR